MWEKLINKVNMVLANSLKMAHFPSCMRKQTIKFLAYVKLLIQQENKQT